MPGLSEAGLVERILGHGSSNNAMMRPNRLDWVEDAEARAEASDLVDEHGISAEFSVFMTHEHEAEESRSADPMQTSRDPCARI